MVHHMLGELREVMLWPGDTVIVWLLTAHPRLALWLGLGADSPGGLFSALISLLIGWGIYTAMAYVMLLGVRLWETQLTCRTNADHVAKDLE